MQELFKDIPNYEGLYQVSNLGNVKSLEKTFTFPNGGVVVRKEKILKTNNTYNGYLNVRLFKDKMKGIGVHRLVAQVFVPNPNNLPQVNHIDGNKKNNRADNLEWCDASFNQEHALETRLKKVHKVKQYDLNGNYIKTWDSIKEVTKHFNISHVSLVTHISRNTKSCVGYKWEYEA